MTIMLFALDAGSLLAQVDVLPFDGEPPSVVLWNDRVFVEDAEHNSFLTDQLAFRETVALRLELPAGAGL